MTLGEARDQLAACVKTIKAEGIDIWTWQGVVVIGDLGGETTWVDPKMPDERPVDRVRTRTFNEGGE